MLPANDAHYRVMYERSAFGVVMTTLDGRVLAANPAACELLGRAVDEALERAWQRRSEWPAGCSR